MGLHIADKSSTNPYVIFYDINQKIESGVEILKLPGTTIFWHPCRCSGIFVALVSVVNYRNNI